MVLGQIVDAHGRLAGKVDDLELTPPDHDPAGRPVVTAILSGRGALARRLGGRLGRLADVLSRRLVPHLHHLPDGTTEIPWEAVRSVETDRIVVSTEAERA